jgi:hypothetical protein
MGLADPARFSVRRGWQRSVKRKNIPFSVGDFFVNTPRNYWVNTVF